MACSIITAICQHQWNNWYIPYVPKIRLRSSIMIHNWFTIKIIIGIFLIFAPLSSSWNITQNYLSVLWRNKLNLFIFKRWGENMRLSTEISESFFSILQKKNDLWRRKRERESWKLISLITLQKFGTSYYSGPISWNHGHKR
jgi:hypothetical protein